MGHKLTVSDYAPNPSKGDDVCLATSRHALRGEPIINTVDEAIKCLMTTGLDALFVGDFLVVKDEARIAPYVKA